MARFLSLAGRYDEALELVEQAIDMAQQLGDDELLGDALNTRGVVRASVFDSAWEADLTRSLELGLRSNSFRAGRAYINLGSTFVETAGDVARGEAVTREGLAFSERMGFSWTALTWFRGNLADATYLRGAWPESLALAEQVVLGEPHYMQQVAFSIRAAIRLARGDGAGAAEDMKRSLHDARAIRDPQALDPALVASAEVAHRNGDLAAATELLEELGSPERAGTWVVSLALLLHDLGRPAAVVLEKRHTTRTPWFEAAVAIADGDFDRAADVLERTGARTFVAAVRLRAAGAYAAQGWSAGAGEHIAPALAFYREVGATAYVRGAEALLGKAS